MCKQKTAPRKYVSQAELAKMRAPLADDLKPFYAQYESVEPVFTVETIRECKRQLEAGAYSVSSSTNEAKPIVPTLCDIEIPHWAPRWVLPAPSQFQSCDHLKNVLERRLTQKALQKCMKALAAVDFDSLAFSGMSGALMAPILAHMMEKEIIMVRIPGTPGCHSSYQVEGFYGSKRYVIVDDLVGSGNTCARIIRGIRLFAPKAELVGLMLYNSFFHSPETETFRYVMNVVTQIDQDGTLLKKEIPF